MQGNMVWNELECHSHPRSWNITLPICDNRSPFQEVINRNGELFLVHPPCRRLEFIFFVGPEVISNHYFIGGLNTNQRILPKKNTAAPQMLEQTAVSCIAPSHRNEMEWNETSAIPRGHPLNRAAQTSNIVELQTPPPNVWPEPRVRSFHRRTKWYQQLNVHHKCTQKMVFGANSDCFALSIYHLNAVNFFNICILFVAWNETSEKSTDKVFAFQFLWVVFAFWVKIVPEAARLLPSSVVRLFFLFVCSGYAVLQGAPLDFFFSFAWIYYDTEYYAKWREKIASDRGQKRNDIQIHSICSNIEYGRARSWRTSSGVERTSHSYTSLLQYVSYWLRRFNWESIENTIWIHTIFISHSVFKLISGEPLFPAWLVIVFVAIAEILVGVVLYFILQKVVLSKTSDRFNTYQPAQIEESA